jgi:hypothetical protein
MFKKMLFSLLMLHFVAIVKAQPKTDEMPHFTPPIPIEAFAGNSYFNFQMIVNKPLAEKSKFGFFNVTSFSGNYKNNPMRNEFLSQGLLTYEVLKGFSLAAGVTMNYKTGLRPTTGVQYVFANREWLLVILPRVDLRDDFNAETFGLIEYKPQLKQKIGLYSRIQVLYNHNSKQEFHDRSYLYARIGLSFRNFQCGLGANLDRYSPAKINGENFGIFLRTQLK